MAAVILVFTFSEDNNVAAVVLVFTFTEDDNVAAVVFVVAFIGMRKWQLLSF